MDVDEGHVAFCVGENSGEELHSGEGRSERLEVMSWLLGWWWWWWWSTSESIPEVSEEVASSRLSVGVGRRRNEDLVVVVVVEALFG